MATGSAKTTEFKIPLPPIFYGDGVEDFSCWARRFEVAVTASNIGDDQLSIILPARLGGAAFSFWDSLPSDKKKDYKKSKSELALVFGQNHFLLTFQSYVGARPRLPGEHLEVYAAELRRLVAQAFPTYGDAAKDGECFRRFIAGIDPYLQIKVHEMGATNFSTALEIAGRIERAQQASKNSLPYQIPSNFNQNKVDINSFNSPTQVFKDVTVKQEPNPVSVNVVHRERDDIRKLQETVETLLSRVNSLELELRNSREWDNRSFRHSPLRSRDYTRHTHDRRSFEDRDSDFRYKSPDRDRRHERFRSPSPRIREKYNNSPRRFAMSDRTPSPGQRHKRYDDSPGRQREGWRSRNQDLNGSSHKSVHFDNQGNER